VVQAVTVHRATWPRLLPACARTTWTHSWAGSPLLEPDALEEPSGVPATASGEPPLADGVVPADVPALADALPEADELGDDEPDEADGLGEPVPGPADGSLLSVGDGAGDCEAGPVGEGEGEAPGASAAQDWPVPATATPAAALPAAATPIPEAAASSTPPVIRTVVAGRACAKRMNCPANAARYFRGTACSVQAGLTRRAPPARHGMTTIRHQPPRERHRAPTPFAFGPHTFSANRKRQRKKSCAE
jgi:hypothetical protein